MSQEVLYVILSLIAAMVLHELGHGVAAYALGDGTAKRAGRLTLNPLRHVDPLGSVILPGVLIAAQLAAYGQVQFLFGWAKPVPVDPAALRWRGAAYPRQLMALVAVAGPAVNLLLAVLGGLLLYTRLPPEFCLAFIDINLVIGLFNLLPVPPMDGGRIAVGVLPLPLARRLAGLERYGIILVFLLLFVLPGVLGQMGVGFDPVGATLGRLLPWAQGLVLTLTGHDVTGG